MAIVGQDILNLLNDNLGGYQNGVSEATKLRRLNEGKDALWVVLREANKDFFVVQSQNSDNTLATYFGNLSTSTREYTLPTNLKEIRFIEVVTSGYEHLKFVGRKLTDLDFQEARTAASSLDTPSSVSPGVYFYAIAGSNQLVLADYPEAALQLRIWYVKGLNDFELNESIPEILEPYQKKIAEYAAKRILLSLTDGQIAAGWEAEWKQSVMQTIATANSMTPDIRFVTDFEG